MRQPLTTPIFGFKIVCGKTCQLLVQKKTGKLENWKNLFGEFLPNKFFQFSSFPVFRHSGTHSHAPRDKTPPDLWPVTTQKMENWKTGLS
jgi:hypothetical protein